MAQEVPTAEQARKVLDLTAWKLPTGADLLHPPRVATLGFTMPGGALGALEFVRGELAQREWSELPGSVATESFASATFTKEGFRVATTISMSATGQRVQVVITHLGNLQYEQLPLPDATVLFSGPATAIFLADSPPGDFLAKLEPAFLASGWRPFGGSETVRSFIKNAVVVNALVNASSAHEGKATVSVTSYLVSHTFPLPEQYTGLHYGDALVQMSFETKQSAESLLAFYTKALQESNWLATSEHPFLVDLRTTQVFRNAAGETITVAAQPLEEGSRLTMRYYSAAEMRQASEAVSSATELPSDSALPEIDLKLPPGAAMIRQNAGRLEFTLPVGKARAALDAMLAGLQNKDQPWEIERLFWDPIAGSALFTRGQQELTVLFTDPGDAPAEVTITFRGIQLKLAREE